jgi:hypothetical protein
MLQGAPWGLCTKYLLDKAGKTSRLFRVLGAKVTGHRVKVDWEIDILRVDIKIGKMAVGRKVLHK